MVLEFYKLKVPCKNVFYTYFKLCKEYFNCLALEIQPHSTQASQHKNRDANSSEKLETEQAQIILSTLCLVNQ